MRPSHLWAAAAVALGVTLAACSVGSKSPTVSAAGSPSTTTTAAAAGGSGRSGASPLAEAVAYSQCIRSHGVRNFPDPVQTPSGGYGYRTAGIDPNSAAWLNWAQCIRAHGAPDFPDPTFSGSEVHDSGVGSNSAQLQSAMDACKSQIPSVGGLGG